MNYRIIKILPIALFSILAIAMDISAVYADDLILQSKNSHVAALLHDYDIGWIGHKKLSEIVPIDYDSALEKLSKQYTLSTKNMNIIVTANTSGSVTNYQNVLDAHYADFHPIIDNELALHPDSLGLIAAHDQISPLEWEDKVKKLSAKGMDHLSYAEKFDLALSLEYDDVRVKRSEPLTDRQKKAEDIFTTLWKEDKQLIVWEAFSELYQKNMIQKIISGAPELETKQEESKKQSALYAELVAYSVGDSILDSIKKAQSNGWKDGPISTYSLSKNQLILFLQFVNSKASSSRPLALSVPEKSPEYQQIGRLNGFGDAAEYAYWQRWIKQIDAQMKDANAAK